MHLFDTHFHYSGEASPGEYMNRILTRWHEAGLVTLEQIKSQDKKPVPKGASGELGAAELEAIQKLLREG